MLDPSFVDDVASRLKNPPPRDAVSERAFVAEFVASSFRLEGIPTTAAEVLSCADEMARTAYADAS